MILRKRGCACDFVSVFAVYGSLSEDRAYLARALIKACFSPGPSVRLLPKAFKVLVCGFILCGFSSFVQILVAETFASRTCADPPILARGLVDYRPFLFLALSVRRGVIVQILFFGTRSGHLEIRC